MNKSKIRILCNDETLFSKKIHGWYINKESSVNMLIKNINLNYKII